MMAQALMDGLIAGAMIGLGAIGITLTYSILRFANFAHGELISWGAYIALAISGGLGYLSSALIVPIGPFSFGWSLPLASVLAVVLTGTLALLTDALLFGRLRVRRGTIIIMVMASFGAALTLRSLLEFLFTSKPAYYSKALQIALPLGGGMRATPVRLMLLRLRNTSPAIFGDSPAEGSSRISTEGSTTSARATASIWRCPPESCPALSAGRAERSGNSA